MLALDDGFVCVPAVLQHDDGPQLFGPVVDVAVPIWCEGFLGFVIHDDSRIYMTAFIVPVLMYGRLRLAIRRQVNMNSRSK